MVIWDIDVFELKSNFYILHNIYIQHEVHDIWCTRSITFNVIVTILLIIF